MFSERYTFSFDKDTPPEVMLSCMALMKNTETIKFSKSEGGTTADNARYGGVTLKEGKYNLEFWGYPCHRHIENLSDVLCVYNQFGRRPQSSPAVEKAYFDWITSDIGPWRSFKNKSKTLKPVSCSYSDEEFMFNYGWVWDDLSAPANLQHSFLTASRMTSEWPKKIQRWHSLWLENSLNRALTFVFLDVFVRTPKKKDDKDSPEAYDINLTNQYDWPFDVVTSDETSVQNFCNGKVQNLNQPFSKSPVYTPVNRIWGENSLDYMSGYPQKLYTLYSDKYGHIPESTSNLGFNTGGPNRRWRVTNEEIIAIIKAEQERLGIIPDVETDKGVTQPKPKRKHSLKSSEV